MAGPITPVLVQQFGWAQFFVITMFIAVPGLILLWWRRRDIIALEPEPIIEAETKSTPA